ncbi:hypothetical protein Hanom_Chr05g00459921 [Helianthus anomalus]
MGQNRLGSKRVRVKKGQLKKGFLVWVKTGSGQNGFGLERVRFGAGSGQNGFQVGSGVEVEEERDGMKIVEVLKDVVLMILLYQLAINGFPAVQTGYPASPVDSAAYTKGNPYLIDGCIEGEHGMYLNIYIYIYIYI